MNNSGSTVFDRQLPLLIRNVENALRAGYNIRQSFEIVAKDMPDPAGAQARQLVDELDAGIDLPQALDNLLARIPSRDLDLVIAALRVQFEVGGNLADKLNLLAQVMDKRTYAANA